MTGYRLIVVPYELGRLRDGVGNGPERLLTAGVEAVLAEAGASCPAGGRRADRALNQTGRGEVDACFDLIRQVAEQVRSAVDEGVFPVVLSEAALLGSAWSPGSPSRRPPSCGSTPMPTSTPRTPRSSGYFDGMGLAVLTGGAWQAMHARVPGARPVPESAVILAGARDFDPPEVRRLEASAVTHLPAGGAGRPRRGAGRDRARAKRRRHPRRPGRPRHRRGPGQHLRRGGRAERRGARPSRWYGLPRVDGARSR